MKCARIMAVALMALVAVQGGCLVGSSSKESTSGNFVPESSFSQLEVGKTTAAFVEATLGKPDSKTPAGDGSEIWKYSYTEKKESSGFVFLIFGGSSEKKTEKAAFVQMKDGVVTKAWRS